MTSFWPDGRGREKEGPLRFPPPPFLLSYCNCILGNSCWFPSQTHHPQEEVKGAAKKQSSRSLEGGKSCTSPALFSPAIAPWGVQSFLVLLGRRWAAGRRSSNRRPWAPKSSASDGGGTERRASPEDLTTQAGSYGRRWFFSWDATYEQELKIFKESGDAGEIWFGEESMTRLIRWIKKQKIPLDSSVLDIGTGNGVLLVELAKCGYTNLTGIDYSLSAVQLSKNIIEKEGLPHVKLQVEDILNPSDELSDFQICIDKGTFDAISLNPENAAEKRTRYVKALNRVLRPGGFFLITSCNWTREELCKEFSEGFLLLEELPTPTFCFGGRTGNTVTALVFQQKT